MHFQINAFNRHKENVLSHSKLYETLDKFLLYAKQEKLYQKVLNRLVSELYF